MENLEMSLFSSGSDLELNLDEVPVTGEVVEDVREDIPPVQPEDTPPVDENIIAPNVEEEIPESVDEGGEGPEEGGDAEITSPNLYSSFASELHNKGVLPSLDLDKTKIDDTDALASVIQNEIDNQYKNFIVGKIGEEGYNALEQGVTLADYQQHQSNVQSLENLTEENLTADIDLAKKVILQDYINQGLTESRAKKILNKTIDLGEEAIIEDALESTTSLKAFEAKRLEDQKTQAIANQKAFEAQQEKIDNDLKHAIYEREEFVDGYKVNKVMQDKVYKSITDIVGESPNGVMENQLMRDRRENPIEFDAKLYYLYELTEKFTNFSALKGKAASKAASDFEKALQSTKFGDSGAPAFINDKDSYDGIGSELVL